MVRKSRRSIPERVASRVMFMADQLCCACHSRGDHIHHIDGNPENNDVDNLVLLCFTHHDEVTTKEGIRRRLTPGVLRRYRTQLYREVQHKRTLPTLERPSEKLFQLMLDAVTVREIQRLSYGVNWDNSHDVSELFCSMRICQEYSGIRARQEVLITLLDGSYHTKYRRTKNFRSLAKDICDIAYEVSPITNFRTKSTTKVTGGELGLISYALEIGAQVAYNGVLKVHDFVVANAGGELLWKILRFVRLNRLRKLKKDVLREFDNVIDAAKRSGDQRMVDLILLYRQHGLTGDHLYPILPDAIEEQILSHN